uniref:Uncharacterized protein n=1 Tax=Arundo donax TaxID=35708 RepID=A0A0A8ZRJ9_ARUDO
MLLNIDFTLLLVSLVK